MINVNFNLYNPWSRRWDIMWNRFLWTKHSTLITHKVCEFNGYRTNHVIDLEFDLTFRGDHAGARVMLGVFGYSVELHFYDTRHWDYETDTWEVYD